MRILVFGAGVLGCNLANNLFRAGKDVTLLARGSWAEEIRTNGLRIKNKFSPCLTVSRVPAQTFVWDTKKVPVRGTGTFFAAFCAGFGFVERLCLALSTEFCYTGTKGRCISWRICWTD